MVVILPNFEPTLQTMPRTRIRKPRYTPDIAERFKSTRREAGMTFKQAAEATGFNESYVKAIEYGSISPSIDFLRSWHKTFRRSYGWILDGS
jgi:transcriptional regulator with XRE-family HTH domain